GGTNETNTLQIPFGTYTLQGGTLVVSSIVASDLYAIFNFGGGTLKANGNLNTTLPMTLTGAGGDANVDTNGYAVTLAGWLYGSGGLNKLGAGTLTLASANTYTGNTTISAGTIKLGSAASLASGAIDVADGATFDVSEVSGGYNLAAGKTLKGGGTVRGNVTIGGVHAPGNSTGIQTVEGDYNMLGELQIELAGTTPGSGYDQVLLSGSGDYNATLGGTLSLDWTGFGDSSEETQLWIVQNDTNGILTGRVRQLRQRLVAGRPRRPGVVDLVRGRRRGRRLKRRQRRADKSRARAIDAGAHRHRGHRSVGPRPAPAEPRGAVMLRRQYGRQIGRCFRPAWKLTSNVNFAPGLPRANAHGLAHGEPRGQRERGSKRGLRLAVKWPSAVLRRSRARALC
ncbi:MAG: autotransporter-associated beta strand repeat-containing protein, partial [Planctomycetes bacterium]|nr:autotransporter-associated beta strand repeat-containing protein [Planctomycetota bacterium]